MIKQIIIEELTGSKISVSLETPKTYQSFNKLSPGLTKKLKKELSKIKTDDDVLSSSIKQFIDGEYKMSIEIVIDGVSASVRMQGSVVVAASDNLVEFERKLNQ